MSPSTFLTLLRPSDVFDRVAAALAARAATSVAREAAMDAALADHTASRLATRDLPAVERVAPRRAADAACVAAIDKAYAVFSAAIAPPAPPADIEPTSSAGEVRFNHEFAVRLPSYARPVKAVADLRVHLGVPQVDRVSILSPGAAWVTLAPRSDAFRRALREIRGPQAGAIRKRAFELMTVDAELVEVIPCRFSSEADRGEARA
jgi:hypothetical protein